VRRDVLPLHRQLNALDIETVGFQLTCAARAYDLNHVAALQCRDAEDRYGPRRASRCWMKSGPGGSADVSASTVP
jgi:hypothetical protein